MSILFDSTSGLLAEMIRATAVRHRVLASNLANVETPGYQAQEVSFSVTLLEAQGRTEASTPAFVVQAVVEPDPAGSLRRDGNTVDLDRQMARLAQNTHWHTAMIQILANRFSMMKAAIRDRA